MKGTESIAATTDFDHHSPELADDPYPAYAKLRAECPVAHSEAWGGFWAVANYRDVVRVALDDDTFCSGQGVALPAIGQARPLLPIESDAPAFTRYRRLLNPLFSPAAIRRFEPQIREIVTDLIDSFIERGHVDFVTELAQPLPARITLRMLGLDEGAWTDFLHRIHVGVHDAAHDLDRSVEELMGVYIALGAALEERHERGVPGDDVISHLAYAEPEGGKLTEEEVLDICMLIMFGGLDTTASAIGHALYYLGRNPDRREWLRQNPDQIPVAIEEFLRFESPVQGLRRTVTCETELNNQRLCPGEKVWVLWASANRDPSEFDHPDEMDLERSPNRHVAFGVGKHRCLGSNLARAMMRISLEEVLERVPDYSIGPDSELSRFADSSVVYGLTGLPAQFTPCPRRPGWAQQR